MIRAMVVNVAQLSTYSHAKERIYDLKIFGQDLFANFLSAMISGFFTVSVSMPLDIAKTRIQNMEYRNGKPEY